ncbi:GNAT family N-acetyltransferase [Govanella unica]|uniref:GNAT family N-acetyltransferase n=1 Tax=Govanella unica TaxID=2975056 RepID=A0A9X3Z893_9PROT|nr:GNAT family N-acetyltransferase [Govania unica]MDA5194868.1 GNAT family N-acetyltransferase [Govania unica]
MNNRLLVRPFALADQAAATAALVTCFHETFAPLIPAEALAAFTLERSLTRFGDQAVGCTWLLEESGQIVGLTQIEGDEISLIYMRQSHLGHGLGQGLIAPLRAAAKESGHDRLRLWCLTSNLRARRFYDRLGTPTGRTKDIFLNNLPLPHLEYEIATEDGCPAKRG